MVLAAVWPSSPLVGQELAVQRYDHAVAAWIWLAPDV
jgi:hypothetical protein